MKKLVFLLFLSPLLCLGSDIDSSNYYQELGKSYVNTKQFEKALATYKQWESYTQKTSSLESELTAKRKIGIVYHLLGNLDSSAAKFEAIIQLAEDRKNDMELAIASNNLGIIFKRKGGIYESQELLKQAYRAYDNLGEDSLAAQTLLNLATSYKDWGIYNKASEYVYRSIELMEKQNTSPHLNQAYNVLGGIQRHLKDTALALKYYRKAIEVSQTINKPLGIAIAENNIGNLYKEIGLTNLATKHYIRSLEIKKLMNDTSLMVTTLLNLGEISLKDSHYSKAEKLLLLANQYALKFENKTSIISSINLLASLYSKNKQCEKATELIHQGKQYLETLKDLELIKENILIEIAIQKSCFPEVNSSHLYSKLREVETEIFDLKKNEKTIEYNIKYKLYEQEKTNEILIEKARKQEIEVQLTRNKTLFGLIITLLIIGTTVVFLYRGNKHKNEIATAHKNEVQLNEKLKVANNNLNNSNELLQQLLNELEHRTKNFLQIIAILMKIDQNEAFDEQSTIKRKHRIDSMLLIQGKLNKPTSNADQKVRVKDYIIELIEHIKFAYGIKNKSVSINTSIKDDLLDLDSTITIGIIINEALTNAYKYVLSEKEDARVMISFIERNNHYTLEINDNGPGIKNEYMSGKNHSKGILFMKKFAERIQGKFNINNEKGTSISITFKK